MTFTKLLRVGCTFNTKTPGGNGEKGNEVTWFPLIKNRKHTSSLMEAQPFTTWHEMRKKHWGFPISLLRHVGWVTSSQQDDRQELIAAPQKGLLGIKGDDGED